VLLQCEGRAFGAYLEALPFLEDVLEDQEAAEIHSD
jgi:hypothetical protein